MSGVDWSRADLVQRTHKPDHAGQAPVTARDAVLGERARQQQVEGWTQQHDDAHDRGELATAARCYLASDPTWWPFERPWWKPKDRRQDLIRAGALAIAEIDRLRRVAAKYPQGRIWAAIHDQLAQETAAARALLRDAIAGIEALDVAAQEPQA